MPDHAIEIALSITGSLHIQPNTLAVVQMVSTAIYGALKTLSWKTIVHSAQQVMAIGQRNKPGNEESQDIENQSKGGDHFLRRRVLTQMGLVGAMRFATVVLGLVSLKYVAASFTETIKASAPFFTVIIAYLMLGEKTAPGVMISLIPVAGGLVMVSASELSFNMIGFMAAVSTNVIECVQNVFSKRLLAREYTASQLQFYTSLTALILQAPIFIITAASADAGSTSMPAQELPNITDTFNVSVNLSGIELTGSDVQVVTAEPRFVLDSTALILLWVDGVLYHLQSVVAYVVMSYLSPVTVSVVNTLKRALLIWISVLIFGNTVTNFTKLGTFICLMGALWYNIARQQKR